MKIIIKLFCYELGQIGAEFVFCKNTNILNRKGYPSYSEQSRRDYSHRFNTCVEIQLRESEAFPYGGKIKSVDNSIHYIDELSDYQLDILKTKKIVSADPGKKFLLYMMDDEGNELKYSCMQRDTESLAKRNRRIKMTNKKVIDIET